MRIFVVDAEDRIIEAEVEVGYNTKTICHTPKTKLEKIVQR